MTDPLRWSMTRPREKRIKIDARMVRHGRHVLCHLAEVAVRALYSPVRPTEITPAAVPT